ncbi:MAG: hypothetical protein QOC87_1689 [Actinomycetota bacterium]|jgi:hypothetical protein|nr:hypothetical protein [Actinomycetota bacterium]
MIGRALDNELGFGSRDEDAGPDGKLEVTESGYPG